MRNLLLTLPYLTLPYLTLPYLTLPYLTLPYLTFREDVLPPSAEASCDCSCSCKTLLYEVLRVFVAF